MLRLASCYLLSVVSACIGAASLVSTAEAANVALSAGILRVEAAPAEALDVVVRPGDPGYLDADIGVTVAPPAGCTFDLGSVVCPVAAVQRLEFVFAEGDDRLNVRVALPVSAAGGTGDDVLRGGDGADELNGGVGADDLDGRAGHDQLDGGAGGDVLSGAGGDDRLAGGDGQDALDGGIGDDRLGGAAGDDALIGGAGDDDLAGGEGADEIDGGDGIDRLLGEAGDDILLGGAGADTAAGGDGVDGLDLGGGADRAAGDAGDDVLVGGPGADDLDGGEGVDRVEGGDDADRVAGADGDDDLTGGDGADRLDGGAGADLLEGGADADDVDGADGDDRVVSRVDGDRVQTGPGVDTLDLSAHPTTLTLDLAAGSARGVGPAADVLLDAPESVLSGPAADVLKAADSGSTLDGGGGDDQLVGGSGRDTLIGGDGRDTADYSARADAVTLIADDDPVSGAVGEGDTIQGSVEVLVGGSGADRLVGTTGPSELVGNAGDDTLEDLLDGASDVLRCGGGIDAASADRGDSVQPDCERWNDGSTLLRSIDPIRIAVRSPKLVIDRSGRMRVSLACGQEAAGECRAKVTIELRHAQKWRRGPERSVLLTPGRRRNVSVFAQRGFKKLVAQKGEKAKARVTVSVRDRIGRTATDRRELTLLIPIARAAQR